MSRTSGPCSRSRSRRVYQCSASSSKLTCTKAMGRGQVVLVLVLLVGGCAAQVTPGSLTASATAYVVYFKNGSVIGTFESLEQCQWGRGNDLRVRTQVLAHRLGLTYERTQELLEAEMSPCTPAQVTQSTAALANYWIATVKLSGP